MGSKAYVAVHAVWAPAGAVPRRSLCGREIRHLTKTVKVAAGNASKVSCQHCLRVIDSEDGIDVRGGWHYSFPQDGQPAHDVITVTRPGTYEVTVNRGAVSVRLLDPL